MKADKKPYLTWEEIEEGFNFTEEERREMEFETQLIEATIKARKKANLTQKQLSERSGIIQPSIAKIERRVRSPQASTLIRLLYPLGYTLKVVPIKKENKKKNSQKKKELEKV